MARELREAGVSVGRAVDAFISSLHKSCVTRVGGRIRIIDLTVCTRITKDHLRKTK